MFGKPEISIESQTPKMTLECLLDAPTRQVFEAWTEAEQVKCWYRPGGSIVCDCDIDLRVNGKWRIVLKGQDGQQHGVSGEYREIDRPRRLVQTFRYDGAPQTEAVETLTFSEKEGKTLVTSAILHRSPENLDWHVQSGAQAAAADVLARLADYLETSKAGATAPAAPDGEAAKQKRNHIPQIAAGLVALVLAGGGLLFASRGLFADRGAETAGDRGRAIRVVDATGVIEAAATTPIRAKSTGKIEAVYCDVGTAVTAGQICARLDPGPFQAIVDRQKAALSETLDKLAKDEAAIADAKARMEENLQLAARRAAARKALEKSRLALERAEARKTSDEAAAARSRAALQSAETSLADSEIRSPIAGIVAARNVEPGQTIGSKDESDLFAVAANTDVRVIVDLSGKDIEGIKVGDKVSFTVEGIPNRVYEGQVGQVLRASAEENTAGDRLIVEAPNADLSLRSGMKATLKISAGRRDAAARATSVAAE